MRRTRSARPRTAWTERCDRWPSASSATSGIGTRQPAQPKRRSRTAPFACPATSEQRTVAADSVRRSVFQPGHPRMTPGSPFASRSTPCAVVWGACSSHRSHRRQPDSRACVEVNRPTVSGCVRRSTGVCGEIVRKPTRGGVPPDNDEGPLTGERAGQRPFFAWWQVQDSNLRSYTATDLQNVAAHAVTCAFTAPSSNFSTNSPQLSARSFTEPMSAWFDAPI